MTHALESPDHIEFFGGKGHLCNVWEWTLSLWGRDWENDATEFPYPYVSEDGRENVHAGEEWRRVLRGGSWANGFRAARATYRDNATPDCHVASNYGMRLVCSA